MKNKLIGLLIVAIYFGNSVICDFFYVNNPHKWWYLNNSILAFCMILGIKYKESGTFIEKFFISMVANNIYVLLVKAEHTYTLNDFWFVAIFTLAQYLKVETKKE